tara:strand:+ start:19 stop:432 length:414 start_codon:yes stop_codon:yes gene_type:complete
MYINAIIALMINLFTIRETNHINDLKWKNRVLIIKNHNKNNFSEKINSFEKELYQRDFVIVHMKEDYAFIDDSKMPEKFTKSIVKKIKNISFSNCIILIGKDGQIKNTYPLEIAIEKIFSDVDKMPMRRYEMKSEIN